MPHVPGGDDRGATPVAASGEHPPGPQVRRDQAGQLVEGLTRRPDQEQPEGPHEAAQEEPDHHERQGQSRAVDEQGVDRRGPLAPAVARRADRVRPDAAVGGLDVEDDGIGDDDGAVAGAGRPPAEVDVVAEQREPLVEAE